MWKLRRILHWEDECIDARMIVMILLFWYCIMIVERDYGQVAATKSHGTVQGVMLAIITGGHPSSRENLVGRNCSN